MSFKNLADLVATVDAHESSPEDLQGLAQDVKMFLWERYDPNDDLPYPTIKNWANLLKETIELNSYNVLTKDDVLSMLFGLIHRTRIVDGLWYSMFERGVTQKLLARLLTLDSDKY